MEKAKLPDLNTQFSEAIKTACESLKDLNLEVDVDKVTSLYAGVFNAFGDEKLTPNDLEKLVIHLNSMLEIAVHRLRSKLGKDEIPVTAASLMIEDIRCLREMSAECRKIMTSRIDY